MPFYEVMCIATMSASQQHLLTLFNRIHTVCQAGGGVIRSIDNLGLRPLASRMRAHTKYNNIGRYIRLQIQVNPDVYSEIVNRLNIDTEIIRQLTIKHFIVPQIHPKTPFFLTKNMYDVPTIPSVNTISQVRHTTPIDYYIAKTLLNKGLIPKTQIMELPRYHADKQWQHNSVRMLQKHYEAAPDAVKLEQKQKTKT